MNLNQRFTALIFTMDTASCALVPIKWHLWCITAKPDVHCRLSFSVGNHRLLAHICGLLFNMALFSVILPTRRCDCPDNAPRPGTLRPAILLNMGKYDFVQPPHWNESVFSDTSKTKDTSIILKNINIFACRSVTLKLKHFKVTTATHLKIHVLLLREILNSRIL